ncbi:hypothetical protein CORC01_05245 [Colletotrichum orchidophilum]|uniref:Uncharacterized protein n=1 Tax=Colletotrichum orchidophilum TaxID=1209926 RepID=A0A1G4BDP7_9PEZI|nr:uncharacterized protein CORC01_05245 [Colletotrichum orchidophilum]OHE99445.1 hypothetical protein CORC01_05245 [Colletotrichum orchidophilum]
MTDKTREDHDQRAPRGHVFGFWKMACAGPSTANWDTAWISEPIIPLCQRGTPEQNLVKEHEGWGSVAGEVMDDKGEESSNIEANAVASSTHFPYPATSLPPPVADFDFRVAVSFGVQETEVIEDGPEKVELTEGVCGSWSGSFGSGLVITGGHDLDKTKLKESSLHEIVTACRLQTSDREPAILEMGTRGFLAGPTDILDGIAHRPDGETRIDPRRYSYRMVINLTTTDERYAEKVEGVLWVGSGMWDRDELVIDAYRID